MPYQTPPDPNLCTFATASDLAGRLEDIGISVGTIYEILENGEKLDTSDDRYVSDGLMYQYVAAIWSNVEQSLAVTDAMFKSKGYNVETFTKLATAAGLADINGAIMQLHGVVRAVNATLTKQME